MHNHCRRRLHLHNNYISDDRTYKVSRESSPTPQLLPSSDSSLKLSADVSAISIKRQTPTQTIRIAFRPGVTQNSRHNYRLPRTKSETGGHRLVAPIARGAARLLPIVRSDAGWKSNRRSHKNHLSTTGGLIAENNAGGFFRPQRSRVFVKMQRQLLWGCLVLLGCPWERMSIYCGVFYESDASWFYKRSASRLNQLISWQPS